MAPYPAQADADILGRFDRPSLQERGHQELLERRPAPRQPLLRISWFGRSHALAPPDDLPRIDPNEDGPFLPFLSEARSERPDQRQSDLVALDGPAVHLHPI